MQTKSVLAALSFTLLCSSSAFSMGPRLGAATLRQTARQVGKTSFRSSISQLPGKGAPRRFFSDNAATPSTAESSFGMRHVVGSLTGGIVIFTVGNAMWNGHNHHLLELEQKRQKKHDRKIEMAFEQRLTREVLELIIKKQLPDEIIKDAKTKTRAKYNKQMNYDEYPRERFCKLALAFKAQKNPRKDSSYYMPGDKG